MPASRDDACCGDAYELRPAAFAAMSDFTCAYSAVLCCCELVMGCAPSGDIDDTRSATVALSVGLGVVSGMVRHSQVLLVRVGRVDMDMSVSIYVNGIDGKIERAASGSRVMENVSAGKLI